MLLRRYHEKKKEPVVEPKPKVEPKKRATTKKKEGETDARDS